MSARPNRLRFISARYISSLSMSDKSSRPAVRLSPIEVSDAGGTILSAGSIESLAKANAGQEAGRVELSECIAESYRQGFEEGQVVGWNRAVELSNLRIEEQVARTRQHIQEKEHIRALLTKERQEVVWQGARIKQLEASIADMQLAVGNLASHVGSGRAGPPS